MLTAHKRLYITILAAVFTSALCFWPRLGTQSLSSTTKLYSPLTSVSTSANPLPDTFVDSLLRHFIDYPPKSSNYADQFGDVGSRVRILRDWISVTESKAGALNSTGEQAIISLFPFLRNPSKPEDTTPFSSLRKSIIPGSKGIVIPTGLGTFRYACHLVLAIREVHRSKLPIQVVYAGDADLPPENRQVMADLVKNIEFLDILTVFDDEPLQLAGGGWAVKSFAALASKYEKIILLDADSVFVQSPEIAFQQKGYKETGVLLYHDRLLWQHAFQQRHEWWNKEMEHNTPSSTLLKSLVWTEDFAEEGDSGLVVIDKGRLPVFMGLLHICWQNTLAVREAVTYRITYGDKESWWFGFELSGTPFAFEKHYGSIAGWLQKNNEPEEAGDSQKIDGETAGNEEVGGKKVCSFTIAHTDDKDKLLWYNGSLLKNKALDNITFGLPTHWMMDATWQKGNSKSDFSCMEGGEARQLTASEMDVIKKSVAQAEKFDALAESMQYHNVSSSA